MLVLATYVLSTTNDRAGLPGTLDQMAARDALPTTVLADSGYAGEDLVNSLAARKITPLIAISRDEPPRAYDFKPPPASSKWPKNHHRHLAASHDRNAANQTEQTPLQTPKTDHGTGVWHRQISPRLHSILLARN